MYTLLTAAEDVALMSDQRVSMQVSQVSQGLISVTFATALLFFDLNIL